MTKRKLYFNLPFLLFLIIGTIYITYQQKSTTYQKSEGKIFGTFYHITYQHNKKLDKEILDELNKVDMALSMFNKESIISRINRNEDVQTDRMFETVYSLAQNVSEETDGAFDITVAPLVNAWGFGFKTGNPPTRHSIDSLRAIVGYEKVSLKGHKIVKKDPRVMLDCSAIAKGYGRGCDAAPKRCGELYGGNWRRSGGSRHQRKASAVEDRCDEAYGRLHQRQHGDSGCAERQGHGNGYKRQLPQLLL